jgi:hypothetical protein
MHVAHFNVIDSKINPITNTNPSRATLIIADMVWLSPSDYGCIGYRTLFFDDQKQIPFNLKLKLVEHQTDRFIQEHPELSEFAVLRELPILLKNLKKIKHPTPQIIREIKQLESAINATYNEMATEKLNAYESLGITQLDPLFFRPYYKILDEVSDGKSFDLNFVNIEHKDILRLQIKEREELPFIFVLVGELAAKEFFPTPTPFDEVTTDANNLFWLDTVFDITGIESFPVPTLELLRESVKEERTLFNQAMDKWIESSTKNSTSINHITYYKENIKPLAEELNKAMWRQQLFDTNKDFRFRNCLRIGAIPVRQLWNFYHDAECINDAELNTLMKEIDYPKYAGSWPVFSAGIYDTVTKKFVTEDDYADMDKDNNNHKRKVISLD